MKISLGNMMIKIIELMVMMVMMIQIILIQTMLMKTMRTNIILEKRASLIIDMGLSIALTNAYKTLLMKVYKIQ